MRVIAWGINYLPEPTGIAPYTSGLAEHLQGAGIEVTVVTGFAYYPSWTKAPADRGRWHRCERLNGITVHRCWQHVPSRLTALGRIWHEASFVLTSFWRVLRLPRADLYFVVSPPLALGPAAWLAAKLKRSRFLFHVQDLQPDSAAHLGMLRPGFFLRFLYACERFTYRAAAGVSGISPGMTAAIAAKGVPPGKISLLPNWARPPAPPPAGAATEFRRRHGWPDDALLAVYSGNLGRKQGLEVMLDAAELLAARPASGRRIVVLIAGDGAGRAELERRLRERPNRDVHLLPLQSPADHAAMIAAADLALITQMPGTGRVCFPSKLLSVVSAGRPVISVADAASDLARAVGEGGFGLNVPAADAAALAAALRTAAAQPELLAQWTRHTRWIGRYLPAAVLPRYEAVVRALAAGEAMTDEVLSTPQPARPFEP